VDTYGVKGTEVMVLRERNPDIASGLVTLLWTHSGTTYTLEVDNFPTLGASPLKATDYLALVADVRYADPPG